MTSVTGPLTTQPLYLASYWRQDGVAEADNGLRAARYLQILRDLAINPYWIGLSEPGADCSAALEGLGAHISDLNCQVNTLLQDCLACFHRAQQPVVQIFAAPILPRVGIDGFCNLKVHPITLMVDPSRAVPADWHRLVIHEVAHGVARSAGHGDEFRAALAHLCLAFDLPAPPPEAVVHQVQTWPPYRPNCDRAHFWQQPKF